MTVFLRLSRTHPVACSVMSSSPHTQTQRSFSQLALGSRGSSPCKSRSWAALSYMDLEYSRYYWPLFNRATRVWSHNLAPYKRSSDPALLQSFDAHNTLIRDTVPEGRLLEFHPSQGWGPLCDFLDLPVPRKEFPRVNDGDYFVEYHRSLYWER